MNKGQNLWAREMPLEDEELMFIYQTSPHFDMGTPEWFLRIARQVQIKTLEARYADGEDSKGHPLGEHEFEDFDGEEKCIWCMMPRYAKIEVS